MSNSYVFSSELSTFLRLAKSRMEMGFAPVLLLTGVPGAGKTSFATAVAEEIGATILKHQCTREKSERILYRYDVNGIVTKRNSRIKGPAWKALEASQQGPIVLLIDEVDKASDDLNAILLELLEEFSFSSPEGEKIKGVPENILVILTSNGRKELPPEILRRCQRISVPFPDRDRMTEIIDSILKGKIFIPSGMLDLVYKIGDILRKDNDENSPSPKEMALLMIDLQGLVLSGESDLQIWREIAASYLTKEGGAKKIDSVLYQAGQKWNWAKALKSEAQKAWSE